MTSAKPIRLLVVDDHSIVRDGVKRMLETDPAFQIVGEASSGSGAFEEVRRLRPDLVLMDIRMPDMDGLAATRRIKQEFPATSVVVLTIYDDPDYLFEAISAGAAGFVLKDISRGDLIEALRIVVSGGSFLNPELTTRSLLRLARQSREPVPEAGSPIQRLTRRQLAVLRLVALGLSNPEIAAELKVGLATVKTHVEHIIKKLHVSDRTHAAALAVSRGLVSAERSPNPQGPFPEGEGTRPSP